MLKGSQESLKKEEQQLRKVSEELPALTGINMESPQGLTTPCLGICSTGIKMFISTNPWQPYSQHPEGDSPVPRVLLWMDGHTMSIYTEEHYLALKKNEILLPAGVEEP